MAQGKSRTQQLNGLPSLAYVGVMPATPINFFIKQGAPTTNDYRNCYVGDMWLDNSSMYAVPSTIPTSSNLWVLVSVANKTASWINFFTNSGGIVISVVGGNNITITGTATNPIVNVSGTTNHSVLLGNTTGSINSLANGTTGQYLIAQTGADPIWSTITNASSFITNPATGTAIPAAGVLTFAGAGGIVCSAAGSTVTITGSGSGTVTGIGTQDGNTVTPTAGVINLAGTHGLNTTGTVGPNTATVAINNAITLGDLANIAPGTAALTIATGDIQLTRSNQTAATNQMITFLTNGGQNGNISMYLNNIFIGQNAGNTTMTPTVAIFNIGIGSNSCVAMTTAERCTFIGESSGTACTTGSKNSGYGYNSLSGLTTGSRNTQCGETDAVNGITTGSDNCFFGFGAGSNYTGAESNNILIGSGVAGVVGESNKTKIGGIRAATTTNADAIAVLIDSAGQLGTVSSSRTKKDNIVDMGSYSDVIRHLRPVVFNYKEHSPDKKSVGLIAEEVETIAPHLVAYNKEREVESVKYHDLVPMLLNEFQKHCELIASLQSINCNLLDRIRILEEYNLKKGV